MKKILMFIISTSLVFSFSVANAFDWKAHSGKTITILMNEHPVLDGIRSNGPKLFTRVRCTPGTIYSARNMRGSLCIWLITS